MLISGCTGGQGADDTSAGPGATPQSGTHGTLLPDFCDQLLTPLTVAGVLQRQAAGGRSAEYEPPRPQSRLRAGMTCRYGIGPGGAAVTVIARAYAGELPARKGFATLVPGGPGVGASGIGDRVRIAGIPGVVIDSSEASTGYLRDGSRVLAVTVRPGGTTGDDGRGSMLQIATAVIRGLPDRR